MKKVFKILLVIIVFLGLIVFLGKLVSFKYINEYPEGSFTRDYYKEKVNHDVIIFGDCEAYTSISPIVIYEEEGITSYVRGNSRQLIGQTYYLLLETLKYETPKVIVLSIGSIQYNSQEREEYNRLILDDMKWSKEKIDMINYSKMDGESILSYIFPLLRYHNRITSLNSDDIKYLFNKKVVSHNGFLINQNVKPYSVLPSKRLSDIEMISEENMDYLQKIVDVCKEKNITIVLEKSPTIYPYWYGEYDNVIYEFARKNNIDYYNFSNKTREIGIDFYSDTYDGGIHLNLTGATKFTKYFAKILKNEYNLSDHSNEEDVMNEYKNKIERYYEEINEKDS